jgi:HD-GYP domain-containing protein (c-di-GMP phosphodiesterase class II)
LEAVSTQAAIAIDNADMFQDLKRSHSELQQAYDETIEGWARALELRDRETQGHALRVTEATLHLARAMGIPDFMMTHIRRGALLHDVGKLGIPDSILHKPGPLTPEEWEIMRKHPVYADQMLSPVDYLRPAKDIPAYHHERWDGSGYPKGLKKNQIPKAARIFAVIDVWDALSSDRPYRTAWNDLRILDYINTLKGREFDPDVVRVFLREFETIRNITHPKNNQNGDGKTLIN